MSSFSTRALTLLSSVFGACGLLLVGVAVSTDYWLLMEEGIVLQQNQTTEVKMALHSGLWRVCFVAGRCYLVVLRFYHLPTLLPKPLIKTQVIVESCCVKHHFFARLSAVEALYQTCLLHLSSVHSQFICGASCCVTQLTGFSVSCSTGVARCCITLWKRAT